MGNLCLVKELEGIICLPLNHLTPPNRSSDLLEVVLTAGSLLSFLSLQLCSFLTLGTFLVKKKKEHCI